MTPRGDVFCDFLTVTMPRDVYPSVLSNIEPYLDRVGSSKVTEGLYREIDGGTLKCAFRGGIACVSASGRMLAAIRAIRLLNDFLSCFASEHHNVSSCDFALDEYVDSPAKSIARAYHLANSGQISFTRKALKPSQVKTILSKALYDDSGLDTGSLYLGRNGKSEVHACVYDKTQERFEKGFIRPGDSFKPTLRHELTISGKMGVSLKDVASPSSCFYHFYPPLLLSPPIPAAEPWIKGGIGFSVTRSEVLPAKRLKHRVYTSPEVGGLIDLAHQCGPEGLALLLRYIREREGMDKCSLAGL